MQLALKELQAAFVIVDNVPVGSLETSRAVRVRATQRGLELSLTGIVFAYATCAAPGDQFRICVDRRFLAAFLSTAKGEKVELRLKDEKLFLKSGYQQANLAAVATKGAYAEWDGGGKVVALPEWIRKDMPLFASYAASAPGSEHLAAVQFIEKYGILASDSLSVAGRLDATVPATLLVPTMTAGILGHSGAEKLFAGKEGMALRLPQGYLYQTKNTRLSKYPSEKLRSLLDAVMAGKADKTLGFHPEQLAEGLSHVGKLSTAGARAVVQVSSDGGDRATFKVEFPGAKTVVQRSVPVHGKATYSAQWSARAVLPFVEHVAKTKATEVLCGRMDHMSWFRAKQASHTYVLVVVDVA